jgi:hypothetical protein
MWAYPLQWPHGWARTENPGPSRFQTSLYEAKNGLGAELARLGAEDPIITTNIPLNRSGWPDTRAKRVQDTGVAAYFTFDGAEVCMPCDRWWTVAENLHAIELTINALRGIERWGAKEMMEAAFKGYAALPAVSSSPAVAWWTTLGVDANASEDEIHRAYRKLARRLHPDTATGDLEQFKVINLAYEQALAAIAS